VTLEQRTGLPETSQTELRISTDRPAEFTLRVRLPEWSDRTTVEVNGQSAAETIETEQWVTLRRMWQPGDTVRLRFSYALRAVPVDSFHPNRVAMAFGPVVLAQDASWAAPFSAPVPWQMDEWESFLKRRDRSLIFDPVAPGTARMPTGSFRPLYEVPEKIPYRVYHDLDRPRII
jgi:hypothetical protein